VVNAVRCAQAIQDAQAVANATRAPDERIETRIGVHLGDVIVQDYRVYGDGVNIAARLQTIAAPGSICVSEAVYQQVYAHQYWAFAKDGWYVGPSWPRRVHGPSGHWARRSDRSIYERVRKSHWS